MDDKDNELMERYIYQVVRRLPKDQRDDVSMELRELIGDMAEEKGSVREALTSLGDPSEFAKKYAGESRCLIGPLYYDTYWKVMKIALACTLIASFVIAILHGILYDFDPGEYSDMGGIVSSASELFGSTLADLVTSALGIFATVTLVFMIMEHYKVDLDDGKAATWSVEKLPPNKDGSKSGTDGKNTAWTPDRLTPVPGKKAKLPRGDSIADIVFTVIFGAIILFAPQIIAGIWVFEEGGEQVTEVIPLFNLEKWNLIMPFILVSFLVGLIDAIYRLIVGRYTIKVMVSNIITGLIQIVIAVILVKGLPTWNPDLSNQIEAFITVKFPEMEFATYFDPVGFSNIFLGFIVFVIALEMIVTVYRTLRFGLEEENPAKV